VKSDLLEVEMIRWVSTETGTRYGFFCDYCKAEIVRDGIAASYGEGYSGEMVYLHKGTCGDEFERDHGAWNGWNPLPDFLIFLKNAAELDLESASESALALGNPRSRDLEPTRLPASGATGYRGEKISP
jgi:hypothetical protein